MSLVRVKEKYQVTLPSAVRVKAGLAVGDYLQASIGRAGVITLTPKPAVDRDIAEGLADLHAGRTHGPYRTADEAIAALEKRAGSSKRAKKK